MKESIEFVAVVDENEVGIQLTYDIDIDTYEIRRADGSVLFSGDFAVLVAVIERALELWYTGPPTCTDPPGVV